MHIINGYLYVLNQKCMCALLLTMYVMVVKHHLVLSLHALDCCFGGLVTHRHSEVRDAFGDLASLVGAAVVKEPVVHDGSAGADTLTCVSGRSGSHR